MLKYAIGDATKPHTHPNQPTVIAHIVNDIGVFGGGFVLAVNRLSHLPYKRYMEAISERVPLGHLQLVRVANKLNVANMFAQRDVVPYKNLPLVRYDSLRECLMRLDDALVQRHTDAVVPPAPISIAMPRIGAGLGRGDWTVIEGIINDTLKSWDVWVYDLQAVPGTVYTQTP